MSELTSENYQTARREIPQDGNRQAKIYDIIQNLSGTQSFYFTISDIV
jgi:hypothetical protein